ncbi:MAG: FtsW/RodA/SpoVE family cell cycle protein [Acidobacteriota bacterium]
MRGTGMLLPRATIGVSRWRRFRAAVDWPLIVTIVMLCTIGMLNLYSATHSVNHAKFDKQVQWMIVGAIGFVVATVIDYRTLVRLAWIGLGGAVVLLLVARLFGHPDPSNHGYTYRWLNVAGMGIQPSELATLMVIPVLARLFRDAEPASYAPAYFAPRLAVLLVPIGLIAVQPDLGTAVLLTLIVLTVGFLAMPIVWPMVYTTAGLLLAIPILWEKLHTYQKDRLLSFIDCNVAPTKTCWHTMQSIYAVGSGKIWGKGFLDGTQNRFGYVPENLTDFPFARWAEEWGFAGSIALLAIFGFLLLWTLNVALSARDRMGSVICVGVAAMTFWHVVVNIAMVLGLAPVVGVTLPFISYGGSSLVTFFLAMGLVANVSLRKHGY